MSTISVIIPTYNRAQYICDAIDSVLAQTYKDYEIIIIDDGSTDNTKELLAKYNGKIQYVYQENGGISSARNTGIRLSKGEYLAFLDSDDAWLPEKLEKQMEAIKKEDGVDFVYTAKYMMDENGKLTGAIHPRYPARSLDDLLKRKSFIPMSVLVKKDLVIKAGMFDSEVDGLEDRDLWVRIAKLTKIKFIPEPLIKYRIHKNNISHDDEKKSFSRIKSYRKIFKDRELKFSKSFKHIQLAKAFYQLGKALYENGKYPKAICALLSAFRHDIFIGIRFIEENDNLMLKLKKIINPFGALLVYTVKAAIK